ncbi:hypothetical protein ASwh1_398 [Aeromonas phage Aswh_1]|nr:hypothetical protein ASwh1_398 [Aeromonas phage Aswh_1]
MFSLNIGNNERLVVSSKWDSGTHLGFVAGIHVNGEYTTDTPDLFLTPEQISKLELNLLMEIKKMLDEYKQA